MSNLRNSKQRDAILNNLRSRYDHPTAEQIYFDLKKNLPSLSLATVYRNLRILEDEGDIIKIPGSDAEHFDGNSNMHYHLTCRKCAKIYDLGIEQNEMINSIPSDFGGIIENHSLMFYGLCPECAAMK